MSVIFTTKAGLTLSDHFTPLCTSLPCAALSKISIPGWRGDGQILSCNIAVSMMLCGLDTRLPEHWLEIISYLIAGWSKYLLPSQRRRVAKCSPPAKPS